MVGAEFECDNWITVALNCDQQQHIKMYSVDKNLLNSEQIASVEDIEFFDGLRDKIQSLSGLPAYHNSEYPQTFSLNMTKTQSRKRRRRNSKYHKRKRRRP